MDLTKEDNFSIDYLDKNSDKDSERDSELNLNILEEHFEELNVDPVLENKEQVENLIKKYIKVIRLDCTDELLKKKMIRKLCELRVRQCELIEEQEIHTISGHQFKLELTTSYCDICMKKQNSIYIPILNNLSNGQLNVCIYCGYSIHVECQSELFSNKKIRECPKLHYDRQLNNGEKNDNKFVILDICVEKSLSDQEYKCNDCKELINFESSLLCDYDGYYYCKNCHNNDQSIIPARILHNWDFQLRSICKNSFYTLNFIKNKPILFNILELNSMLYGFIDELPIVKRLRYELNLMVKYIVLCKQPNKPKITLNNHLINSDLINYYSLSDLQDLIGLKKVLTDFHCELFNHITKNCETCKGNGFYCELCPEKGDILFPFSPNISLCPKCHAVYHKNCFYRKKTCTRCKRIEKKENELVTLDGKELELKTIDLDEFKNRDVVDSRFNEIDKNIDNKDIIDEKDKLDDNLSNSSDFSFRNNLNQLNKNNERKELIKNEEVNKELIENEEINKKLIRNEDTNEELIENKETNKELIENDETRNEKIKNDEIDKSIKQNNN